MTAMVLPPRPPPPPPLLLHLGHNLLHQDVFS
jgi:hypothetical protein